MEDITLAPKKLIRTRRASEGSASEPSLARRVSMCKDAKLSCRGNNQGSLEKSERYPDGRDLESDGHRCCRLGQEPEQPSTARHSAGPVPGARNCRAGGAG